MLAFIKDESYNNLNLCHALKAKFRPEPDFVCPCHSNMLFIYAVLVNFCKLKRKSTHLKWTRPYFVTMKIGKCFLTRGSVLESKEV